MAEIRKPALKDLIPSLHELSGIMNNEPSFRIESLNWPDFNYKPETSFSIAYSEKELFLKYFIKEIYYKAEKIRSNEEVYEDSCVEFFVSPGDDGIYYNFEFNGIGTCLMGVGRGREGRKRANPDVISAIRRLAIPGLRTSEITGEFSWTLVIAIPFSIFYLHNIEDPIGNTFSANFYKCGDKLSVRHYVTWNAVVTDTPAFHRPEFFGELSFR